MTILKTTKKDQAEAKKYILQVINDMVKEGRKPKIQIFIKSTSQSGMSRQMIVLLDGFHLTSTVQQLFGQNINTYKNTMTVKGCGMDMTFWLANEITYYLWTSEERETEEVKSILKGNGGGCLDWQAIY